MLFWSHFKSAIEHFYIKIKEGFHNVFTDLMEVGTVKLVKYFLLAVTRRYFFCGSFVLFLSCVFYAFTRLLIDALRSPRLKGLTSWLSFVMSNCVFVTFPCGILGQMWYLIVLIADLCPLSYFS